MPYSLQLCEKDVPTEKYLKAQGSKKTKPKKKKKASKVHSSSRTVWNIPYQTDIHIGTVQVHYLFSLF